MFVTEVPSPVGPLGTVSTWLLTLLTGIYWKLNGFPRVLLVWLYQSLPGDWRNADSWAPSVLRPWCRGSEEGSRDKALYTALQAVVMGI